MTSLSGSIQVLQRTTDHLIFQKSLTCPDLKKSIEDTVDNSSVKNGTSRVPVQSDNNNKPLLDSETLLALDISETKEIVSAFFSNDFSEANRLCESKLNDSMYHAFAKGCMAYVNAVFTLERDDLRAASDALKSALSVANSKRFSKGFLGGVADWFRTPNYDEYSDEACHAELVHAEMQGLLAGIGFLEDNSLMSLIRSALRFRSAHKSHMECFQILKHKNVWTSKYCYEEYRTGALCGNGLINLALSYLPNRVLKLVEMVGYSGDRDVGLQLMKGAAENRTALRFPFISAMISCYNLYIQHLGLNEGDIDLAESILNELREKFPHSYFLQIYYAKLQQLRGNLSEAIVMYKNTIEENKTWKQLHIICYWELLWSHAIRHEWDSAMEYALFAVDHSVYGKAIYQHIHASFLYMKMTEEKRPELKAKVRESMKRVSSLRQRYAGKTVPPEKFAVSKAQQYLDYEDQDDQTSIPAYDLFYFYNIFILTSGKESMIQPMMVLLNQKLEAVKSLKSPDAFANVQLIRGVLLRMSGHSEEAISCFMQIVEIESLIRYDTYIPPLTCLEMAISYIKEKKFEDAKEWIDRGMNDYHKYLCETYVHVRFHAADQYIRLLKKQAKRESLISSPSPALSSSDSFKSCQSDKD